MLTKRLNQITTTVGLLLIIAAGVSVFTHDRSWVEVMAVVPTAIGLFFVENDKAVNKLKGKEDVA